METSVYIVVAFCGAVILASALYTAYSFGYRAALRWAQSLLD